MTKPKESSFILQTFADSSTLDEIKAYLKTTSKAVVMQYDNDAHNGLYYAVLGGNIDIVHALIEYGFNPNDIDRNTGATALHLAALNGNFDLALYLMDIAHMDINVLDKDGRNPLYYALMSLNKNGTGAEFSMSMDHLDVAWLLAGHGAKFQPDMHEKSQELEKFECVLLQYIHQGIKNLETEHATRNLNFVKFITDAMEYYKLFLNDISRTLPDINLFGTPEFKKSIHKIPLVFGWQISKWDLTTKHLVSLSPDNMEPVIYDLTSVSPLLINVGDIDANLVTLIDEFNFSLHQKFASTDIKIVNIVNDLEKTYVFDGYFDDVTTTSDTTAILDLSAEVDRRKNLSTSACKKEIPILCFMDDLSKITNKKLLGDIQNILMNSQNVGIYVIAVVRSKIPPLLRANFQSVITFHTTNTESKKLIGCENAVDLGIDELLFDSPVVHSTKPIHIKMEK